MGQKWCGRWMERKIHQPRELVIPGNKTNGQEKVDKQPWVVSVSLCVIPAFCNLDFNIGMQSNVVNQVVGC